MICFSRGVVTEEFRIQMQTQDKFNGMPSVPPMVVQPLSSGIDPMGKSYSNLEVSSWCYHKLNVLLFNIFTF